MNKKQYKSLWITTQLLLLILPMMLSLIFVKYNISYDKHYVNTVYDRAKDVDYATEDKLTDFTNAVVAKADIDGEFETLVWKLQHQELYYYEAIGCGLFLGILFQLINIFWCSIYMDKYVYD